jgi:Ca2+-binding RTX toxin-like protein
VANAQVTDNLASSVRFLASTGTQSGNVLSAWNGQKGVLSYASVYADAWAGASATIDDFLVKSAYAGKGASLTPLHQAGAGTATTSPAPTPAPPTSSSKTISGTDGRNELYGTSAAETILGRGATDVINAGSGNDILDGGAGKDWLVGQGGNDIFVFSSVADIGRGSTRDVISAWGEGLNGRGHDMIDLRSIDADIGISGNQAFRWLGTGGFTGKAGELRTFFDGTNTIVEGTVNADRVADFQIQISGKIALATADFLF